MAYKSPDELTGMVDSVYSGVAKGFSILQQFNSLQDAKQQRKDDAVARKQKKVDYTVDAMNTVGGAMLNAIKVGDTVLAEKLGTQVNEMGAKIQDTGDEVLRNTYKTYRTLHNDVKNDVKTLNAWDSFVSEAESTGGSFSYDSFAEETTKLGLQQKIEKRKETLRGWRRKLTNENISSIAEHGKWITNQEAVMDRLTQIAGRDGVLPSNANAEERQMFIASLTGVGYNTPETVYRQKKESLKLAQVAHFKTEGEIAALSMLIATQQKDPVMGQEAWDEYVIGQKDSLRSLQDQKAVSEDEMKVLERTITDKAYDWAGEGSEPFQVDTQDWNKVSDEDKKILKTQSDEILLLKDKDGWKNGELSKDSEGFLAYENGVRVAPVDIPGILSNAQANFTDFKSKENIEADKKQLEADKTKYGDAFPLLVKHEIPFEHPDPKKQKEHEQKIKQLSFADKEHKEADAVLVKAKEGLGKIELAKNQMKMIQSGEFEYTYLEKRDALKEQRDIIEATKKEFGFRRRTKKSTAFGSGSGFGLPSSFNTKGTESFSLGKAVYYLDEKLIEKQIQKVESKNKSRKKMLLQLGVNTFTESP